MVLAAAQIDRRRARAACGDVPGPAPHGQPIDAADDLADDAAPAPGHDQPADGDRLTQEHLGTPRGRASSPEPSPADPPVLHGPGPERADRASASSGPEPPSSRTTRCGASASRSGPCPRPGPTTEREVHDPARLVRSAEDAPVDPAVGPEQDAAEPRAHPRPEPRGVTTTSTTIPPESPTRDRWQPGRTAASRPTTPPSAAALNATSRAWVGRGHPRPRWGSHPGGIRTSGRR